MRRLAFTLAKNSKPLFNVLLFSILLSCFSIRAQVAPIFQEFDSQLTFAFEPVGKMAQDLYNLKYKKLHRSEGMSIFNLLQSSSLFTRMLHKSGSVNFNSEATKYLNELKDHVLKDYSKEASAIRIYITFDPALNAFATINKNIYFNVGLLARVKNEAQLAYIMCHEIMHIIQNHSVEQFKEMNSKISSVGSTDVSRKTDNLGMSKHNMSQIHEFEADELGMHLYLTAGYKAEYAYDALKLLKEAEIDFIQKKISKEIMGLKDAEYDSLVAMINRKDIGKGKGKEKNNDVEKIGVSKDSSEDESDVEREPTHPEVDERLIEIEKILKEFSKTHKETAAYLVSEQLFKELNLASQNFIFNSQNQTGDFVSAFLFNSAKIIENQDVTENDYEHLAYAIFGIIHDKKYKVKYNFHKGMSHVDSVFNLHYKINDFPELTLWGLGVLDQFRNNRNQEIFDNYITRIVQLVGDDKDLKDSLSVYVQRLNIETYKNESLSFSDIDFYISFYAGKMSNERMRKFNNQVKKESKKDGKIVFLDMKNFAITTNYKNTDLDLKKTDQYDDMNVEVFEELVKNNQKEMMLLIPNSKNYGGKSYTNYSLLLNWVSERIYFDKTPYKSLYARQIKEFCDNNDAKYAMLGLNITLKKKSFEVNLKRVAGLVLNVLYLPIAIAERRIELTRNYQLTLIFDLESGDLVFWDSRTSREPLNKTFMYATYNDILQSFKKK